MVLPSLKSLCNPAAVLAALAKKVGRSLDLDVAVIDDAGVVSKASQVAVCLGCQLLDADRI